MVGIFGAGLMKRHRNPGFVRRCGLAMGGARLSASLVFILLGVSMSADAGLFGQPEYVTWQEEVKLNDGRIIVVTQKKRCFGAYTGGNYASCITREAWLTIKLPELGNKEIVWHEHLSPLILNIHAGQLYVVGIPPTGLEFRTYGKPQPPYVGFVFKNGQWKRIPFEAIPEAIYNTNMLIKAMPPDNIKSLTLPQKESREMNGNPHYTNDQKQIDPKHKSNFH